MNELVLTARDRALLAGRLGEAATHAMAFLQRLAQWPEPGSRMPLPACDGAARS